MVGGAGVQLEQALLLVAEVRVDDGLGDPAGAGDVGDRGRLVALLGHASRRAPAGCDPAGARRPPPGRRSGSTRLRIERDCNGQKPSGDRTHRGRGGRCPRGARCLPGGDHADRPGTTAAVRPSARAYVVWVVALTAYAVAVFHRASLGVAAVDAQERFSAGASAISLFLVLQLAVYAALQVPVGRRAGPVRLPADDPGRRAHHGRRPAACWRWPPTCPTAIAARVLVGAGDAMTFISVLRVIGHVVPRPHRPADHPAHRHLRPARLDRRGLSAGGAAARHVVADDVPRCRGDRRARRRPGPGGPARRPGRARSPPPPAGPGRGAAPAWPTPGGSPAPGSGSTPTSSPSSPAPCSRCCGAIRSWSWGRGCSPATAAGLLTLLVVVGMGVGPLLGRLCGRWPLRRSVLVFTILGADRDASGPSSCSWPGRAPLPLLIVLVVVLGTNGPGLDDRLRLRAHREPGRAAWAAPAAWSTSAASSPRC